MAKPERIVVVDCETTGFSKLDRIVEIAAVQVDLETANVVDEFETLINPERDMGATHIHGVTAAMVSSAPTFAEVAGALGRRLGGAALAAHNLPFDSRFLRQEFDRLGTQFEAGNGYCTYKATKQKLVHACEYYGIPLVGTHRALNDARATAQLLALLHDDEPIGPDSLSACFIARNQQRPSAAGTSGVLRLDCRGGVARRSRDT